jgi:hypothetical protein
MAAGSLASVGLIQLFGFLIFLMFVIRSNVKDGMAQIMILVPNIAIMSISSGSGLLGLAFIIMIFKIISGGQKHISIRPMCVVTLSYLLSLSFLRIFDGNYYDFALIVQVSLVVVTWTSLLKSMTASDAVEYIDFFRFGCLLMAIGMLIGYPFEGERIGRFRAIGDDCNYTGAIMSVLLGVSLLTYCYKLPLKHNMFYMGLAGLMGLATGSRGFMLSVAILLVLLLLTRSFGKKTAKFVIVVLFLMTGVYVLYLVGVGPVVTVYNNTVGRTMELEENHVDGDFMDVTSGRSVLWAYYMAQALRDQSILYFGRGFNGYFLETNGGFGLAAHNMYISSIIGIGIIGTILVLLMYFSILKFRFIKRRRRVNWAFSSIIISLLVNYFFLDGMLELRLITYHTMVGMMLIIYRNNIKKVTQQ